jgi:hypothetical protein
VRAPRTQQGIVGLRFEKTLGFMATSVVFMFLALLVGILRLMSLNFFATGILVDLYPLHSIIMVFGFLAVIIMTERVAGVRMIPGDQKLKAPVVMVPSVILGVVVETIGYAWRFSIVRFLGAFLLMVGCVAFMATLRFLRRNSEAKVSFDFMTLSAVSLLLAAIVSAFTIPVDDMGFIMLLLSFPILFILGERIELTRIVSTPESDKRFRRALTIAAASIVLFVLGSVERVNLLANLTFLTGSILLLVVFCSVLIVENQNLRLLLKSPRPLQHYVSHHVRVAYGWAVIGMVLAVAYSLSDFEFDLYDPFIHSLTLGFIGTMMLAHGPVILPGVLKRGFNEEKLAMLPLYVLTLAIVLRVAGELILLVSYSASVRVTVGISGWLVLIAVLLFLRSIAMGIIEPANLNDSPVQRT